MSITYPQDRADAVSEETIVPVYARTRASRGRKSGVRTWMILAPIGVLVIGGAAAMMLMTGRDDVAEAPLAEAAATAPVLPTTPAPLPMAAEPAPVDATPLPVMRQAAPAPARREAPVVRRAAPRAETPAPAPAPSVAPPAASPITSTLNSAPAAPAPTVTPTPAPPVIVVEPLN